LRYKPIVLVDVDRRPIVDHAVSPNWDWNTGKTDVVVADSRTASVLVCLIEGDNAGDPFHHPFRYAP
jgi:hypothetical protein